MKNLIHFYSLPYLWANLAGILWFSLLLVLLLKESESLYLFPLSFLLLSTFQFLPIPLYLLLEQLFADYDFMIFNRFLYTVCFLLNIILAIVLFFASFRCLFLLKRQVVNQDMRYLLLQILFAFGINIFQLFGLFSLLPRL